MHACALSSPIQRGHLIVSPEISFCCFILFKGRLANFLLATFNEGGVACGELLVNVSVALKSGERLYFRDNMPGETTMLHERSNTKANECSSESLFRSGKCVSVYNYSFI